MTLPTFLLIGAMKAGTSSLHRYLGGHPDVFVPEVKEPDFFLGGDAWERGLDWYEALFEPGAGARARGEASTRYSKDPLFEGVPERVARTLPDVVLLYILRHPVERIVSHHRHAVAEWGHPTSLREALASNQGEYLVPTRYGHQVGRWLEHFPRERLLVVTAEELDQHRVATLRTVFDFLGVDPTWQPPDIDRKYNRAGDHRVSGRAAKSIRDIELYRAVKAHVPKRLRHAAWRVTSQPSPIAEPELPPGIEEELVEKLRPDLHLLRELLPGFGCWGLLDDGSVR